MKRNPFIKHTLDKTHLQIEDQLQKFNIISHYIHCVDKRRYSNAQYLLHIVTQLPLEMVSAGLHWDRSMSRHILPFELMFGW